MLDSRTLRVAAALVDPARRRPAARDLASALGAADLLLLVRDAGTDAFVPAPAFPPTLPGGPAWRDLLERLREAGVHHARVGYPEADPPLPALAYAERDVALVLLGGRPDAAAVDVLRDLAPLLAAVLRAEHEALAARGELKVAQEHARHTETLARALDSARAEVERSMIALGRQARELEEARARAEEATRAKDAFLAMLGHELRNPLSPMLTAIQLLRLKDRGSRELDVIERQVQSLMRLVDDLLDISRITRGRIELRKQRIELADVAARAIEMAGPVLEQNRQVLAVQIPPRGCLVDADPARLAQVFANLLTNAAKYSDPDTEILFAAEQDEAHVRIRVRDRGIGIDPAMLERVFEPFVQHRQALDRSQGGLGLGLAIARSLVALHGGTITAHSEGEGRGSEFVVELPRPRAEAEAPPPAAPLPPIGRPARTPTRPARVLVVDDNEDATTMMSEALAALGHTVRTARDAPSAIDAAREFHPEIALLDLGLPGMDGYELARRLKAIGDDAVRLVAVTGYGQSEDRRRSEAAGFEAHLVKPVTLDELQELLDRLTGAAG